jgi:hypothetical protein
MTQWFFFIFFGKNFNKKISKINQVDARKTKSSKNSPIYLSKYSQKFSRRKHMYDLCWCILVLGGPYSYQEEPSVLVAHIKWNQESSFRLQIIPKRISGFGSGFSLVTNWN